LSADLKQQATATISQGVSIVSDAQLQTALDATTLTASQQQAVLDANRAARLKALRASLLGIGVVELGALLAMRKMPKSPLAAATRS
jgi:hypothetical protein